MLGVHLTFACGDESGQSEETSAMEAYLDAIRAWHVPITFDLSMLAQHTGQHAKRFIDAVRSCSRYLRPWLLSCVHFQTPRPAESQYGVALPMPPKKQMPSNFTWAQAVF